MIVCSNFGQTEGLPFVIGAENKKASTSRTDWYHIAIPLYHKGL